VLAGILADSFRSGRPSTQSSCTAAPGWTIAALVPASLCDNFALQSTAANLDSPTAAVVTVSKDSAALFGKFKQSVQGRNSSLTSETRN
jgi:hypothetical protein